MFYKIIVSDKANKDINRITEYLNQFGYNSDKIIKKLNKDIESLSFMPRTNKTISSYENPIGDYRRMLSGKYSIIYKIVKDKVIILRIFNQKENYLNQRKFILREKSQKYILNLI